MATGTALKVLWYLSPRIILIDDLAVTSITVQDLTDSIKDVEDEPANLSQEILVLTSGKQNLGGGLEVGITAELQNAQVAFSAQLGSDSTGTATTANSDGNRLIDSAGTFQTDGIVAGDTVINLTDGSVSTVTEVISETELTHFVLQDGTDNDWDVNDNYKVWNKIPCEVTGGNLVAVDDVGGEINPLLPTYATYASRIAASTGTGASSITAAVWDEATTDHETDGTFGEAVGFIRRVVAWLRDFL